MNEWGVEAADYLESVATFAKAGYTDISDELGELATKTQLVGDTTAETANQFLLAVDAAWKMDGSVSALSTVLDEANAIENKYATTIDKIAAGLPNVAPELPSTDISSYSYYCTFSGCNLLTSTPELPITTIRGSHACNSMFLNCTLITTIPKLYATRFYTECYGNMFSGCTSLIISDGQTVEASYAWKIPNDSISSSLGLMADMFTNCLGTRLTDSPDFSNIQKTYYTQNEPV